MRLLRDCHQVCVGLIVFLVLCYIPVNVHAGLSVVADLATPVPGGVGNFSVFNSPVASGAGGGGFLASEATQEGVYTIIGGSPVLVADLSTAIPGGVGNFTGFGNPISLGGGDVAFRGLGSEGQSGIYTFIGGTLAVAADENTAIPGGSGNFTAFGNPISLGGGDVVFRGLGFGGQSGIYTFIGGTLAVVADLNTAIPGGSGNFTVLSSSVIASLGGGDLAFLGLGSGGQSGIYTFIGGTLAVAADENTAIPGGSGNFTAFGFVIASLGGGDLAFLGLGSGGQSGIYMFIGGMLAVVADLNTARPGASGTFGGFGTSISSMGGGDLAFYGFGLLDDGGIYTFIGGTLAVVADLNTAIPGGVGNFTGLSSPVSLGGGDVVFFGYGPLQRGIYSFIGGTLAVVADLNTAIPGGSGTFHQIDQHLSMGGGDVAFVGFDSEGQIGIYTFIGGTLAVAADLSTAIPGGSGNFTGFGYTVTGFGDALSIDGGHVAFRGFGPGQQGIYTFIEGTLAVAADEHTAIPGGSGNFTGFGYAVSVGGADAAFSGFGSGGQSGIYTFIEGTLAAAADEHTAIPGGSGNFTAFGNAVSIGGGDLVFPGLGSEGQRGIYTFIGGTLAVAADLSTAIPGGSGNFTAFGFVIASLGGGDAAFSGFGSEGQRGIYTFIGGTLAVAADLNTAIPGGSGNFTAFGNPVSLGGGDAAFLGSGSGGQSGIYTFIGGTLAVAADLSTAIPGGSGNFIGFNQPVSLGGGDVAFRGFGDLQEGIYKISNVVPTEVFELQKEYRFKEVCFEKDNDFDGEFSEDPVNFDVAGNAIDDDGDGVFNEDDVDCPGGTDLGTPLPIDQGSGNFLLEAVTQRNGTVRSYVPGQYYAVSTVEVLTDLDTLWIAERYGECTDRKDGDENPLPSISALNPKMGTGGGNVLLVQVVDGVAYQIADSTFENAVITDDDDNGVPDKAEAHLLDVKAGDTFLVYVKFGPGLTRQKLPLDPLNMCHNETVAMTEEEGEEVSATADLIVLEK
jgi:hypothetical protein